MSFEDNREFWKDFIEIYREKRCLWDIKSKYYKNKQLRNGAYEFLVLKCKALFPTATKDFVIKKIALMRSSFRREVRRINEAKKSGSATGNIPECTLWYFDLLSFLLDQEEVRVAVSSLEDESGSMAVTDEQSTQDSTPETPPETPSTSQIFQGVNTHKRKTTPQLSFAKKKEQFLEAGLKVLQQPDCTRNTAETQEMSFGINVGHQLEGLQERQKIIAQKIISDVLFYAKMNYLQESTRIQLENIPQQALQYAHPQPQQLFNQQSYPFLQPQPHFSQNAPPLAYSSEQQQSTLTSELSEFMNLDKRGYK